MMIFALTAEDKVMVHISNASKGHRYVCALCQTPLSVVQGTQNRHHFRHVAGRRAQGGGGETNLHRQAIEHIVATRGIVLNNSSELVFDQVATNVSFHKKVRPDIVGIKDGKHYAIEIRVTHAVSQEKVAIFKELNVNAIEIDLSSWHRACPSFASPAGIAQLLNRYAPHQWLSRQRRFPRLYHTLQQLKHWLFGIAAITPTRPPAPYQFNLDLR
ncbi:hypothetical protein CWI80_12295 [Pseudidiomarina sediminum]|uniref:Competence protein n=1 Tax=Pseudidiomarina sediminum TaxID=431675 RepID=A0A432YZF3_9GAMM|nr:hypothetical protein [Pseudidiomarina sediminum]RUO69003.1 hypothetical protein CWI80_12295 [Pseudidiomarina sediminum]